MLIKLLVGIAIPPLTKWLNNIVLFTFGIGFDFTKLGASTVSKLSHPLMLNKYNLNVSLFLF